MLERDNIMFKNAEYSPDYTFDAEFGKKRMNTHILQFDKYLERNEKYLFTTTGISDKFGVAHKP